MKRAVVIGEKPSQIKKFVKTLLGDKTEEVSAGKNQIIQGTWNKSSTEYFLRFLALSGHITEVTHAPGYDWYECLPVHIVEEEEALIVVENPEYRKVITQLVQDADEIWLATDPDSEGDNIAYEALQIALRTKPTLVVRRIWNASLTKKEILRAFENPTDWNEDLALAVQGRRIVDAWVGFAGTRELTRAVKKAGRRRTSSVGRVQLPLLKLVVDRDRERANFQPEDRWNLLAHLREGEEETIAEHKQNPFEKEEEMQISFKTASQTSKAFVISTDSKISKRQPPKPLNTTSAIALICRLTSLKAQGALNSMARLYHAGLLSYPRTDNTRFVDDFPHREILDALSNDKSYKDLISKIKDKKQVRVNGKKRGAEDHDPIHPTGEFPSNTDEKLSAINIRVWKILTAYYIGLFLENEETQRDRVTFDINNELFIARGVTILKKGWTEAHTWATAKAQSLPQFTVDQEVLVQNIEIRAFQTKPRPRWNDASLIKELENLNIGTKSSRPAILQKLIRRKYLRREKKAIISTYYGQNLIEMLEPIWEDVVTPNFTRHVEELMGAVAEGQSSYDEMLQQIREKYLRLHKKLIGQLPSLVASLQKKKTQISRKIQKLEEEDFGACPKCEDGKIVPRGVVETGELFLGCSNYPKCDWSGPLPDEISLKDLDELEDLDKLESSTESNIREKSTLTEEIPEPAPKDLSSTHEKSVLISETPKKGFIGPCREPNCSGELFLHEHPNERSRIQCTVCETTYMLPLGGKVEISEEVCSVCGNHIVIALRPNKKIYRICPTCKKYLN
ncbi:MAG: DNA topoisomerase [Promethearchaeota archaeon]